MFQIRWHFQVFQTIGHPVIKTTFKNINNFCRNHMTGQTISHFQFCSFSNQLGYFRLVGRKIWHAMDCTCTDAHILPHDIGFSTRYLWNDATYTLDDYRTLTGNHFSQINWYHLCAVLMTGSARNHVCCLLTLAFNNSMATWLLWSASWPLPLPLWCGLF